MNWRKVWTVELQRERCGQNYWAPQAWYVFMVVGSFNPPLSNSLTPSSAPVNFDLLAMSREPAVLDHLAALTPLHQSPGQRLNKLLNRSVTEKLKSSSQTEFTLKLRRQPLKRPSEERAADEAVSLQSGTYIYTTAVKKTCFYRFWNFCHLLKRNTQAEWRISEDAGLNNCWVNYNLYHWTSSLN